MNILKIRTVSIFVLGVLICFLLPMIYLNKVELNNDETYFRAYSDIVSKSIFRKQSALNGSSPEIWKKKAVEEIVAPDFMYKDDGISDERDSAAFGRHNGSSVDRNKDLKIDWNYGIYHESLQRLNPEERTSHENNKSLKVSSFQESHNVSQEEKLQKLAANGANGEPSTAVLVFACNRLAVRKCLDKLLKYRHSANQFPIIVSQDCGHAGTARIISSYGSRIAYIKHPEERYKEKNGTKKKLHGYENIARHYFWALNETFSHFKFQSAIIVEDDLLVAPDFFEYFKATLPILRQDPTLMCVSAWNDNGLPPLVDEAAPELLHRTDFFPGLGWLLTRDLWSELSPKWPASFWDDWLRQPEQRRGRACIRPELSRSRHFGNHGVSKTTFLIHNKRVFLSERFVPFTVLNLSYLLIDNYDLMFVRRVYNSPVVTMKQLISGNVDARGSVRLPYHSEHTFKRIARTLGLMFDLRSGIARTAYRGVVSFMKNGRRVYIAPYVNRTSYNSTWIDTLV